MKRILSVSMILVFMLSLLPAGTVSAEATVGETVTKLVNVAKNKPVTTEHSRSESYDPRAIVDDNVTTGNFWYGYVDTVTKPHITIDLQRRYPIEKIRIFDRGDTTMPTRGQFEIWGADCEDFSDARLLFELADNNAFPAKFDLTVDLSDKPVCRYIRYQAKNAAVVYLREIQVFATVTATEISRTATTYTSTNLGSSSMGGSRAVDGMFNDGNSMYLKSGPGEANFPGVYSTLTVDLGTEQHVDMLEMYDRFVAGSNNNDYLGNFTIYGSGEGTVTDFAATSPDGVTAYQKINKAAFEALSADGGVTKLYTALAGIPSAVGAYTANDGTTYIPYPHRANEADRSCWQSTVDNTQPYRYLTYRKDKTSETGWNIVHMSEFRAYQFHPDIFDVTYEDGTITLDCSEELTYDSLLAAITITNNATGEDVFDAESMTVNPEKPYQVLITLPEMYDATLTLSVSESAQSTKGVALGSPVTKDIELPAAIEVVESYFTTETGGAIDALAGKTSVVARAVITNNSSSDKPLLMIACAYDANHTLKGVAILAEAEATGEPETLGVLIGKQTQDNMFSVTLEPEEAFASGDYVVMHLWNGVEAASAWAPMTILS